MPRTRRAIVYIWYEQDMRLKYCLQRYPFVFHPSSLPQIATVDLAEELCVVDSALSAVLCVQTTKANLSLTTIPARAAFHELPLTIIFSQ